MKIKSRKGSGPRHLIQLVFFAIILLMSINHTLVEQGKGIQFVSSASIHSVCPFGGVASIYKLFAEGTFIKKIHEASFVVMVIGFIMAVGFGAIFCGWICPLGSIQEWTGKLGRKIFRKKYNNFMPYRFDKYLRYLRYGALAWVLYMTARSGDIIFSSIDPYSAMFNLWSSEAAIGGVIVLIAVLLGSIFIERPWCKYLCPYGAILGITNRFRVFKIRRNESSCLSCKACDRVCPMNIKVSNSKIVYDHQCITCMKCTSEEGCPVENTVDLSTKGGIRIEG